MTADIVLQTHTLTHRYGDFVAIRDVNLSVRRGEIFGFLGPNGAGKTTTIRTMLDFIRPTEGHVSVLGMDSRADSLAIRERIGYLPSELALWENWTGTQYIRWLEDVRHKPLLEEARRLADRLDFDLDRSLAGMSTGMKRKIALIATMAHRPELLILDEPTTGLDPLMQQAFNAIMRETRDEGRTVFLSSHILTEVEDICDRVAIIRGGEIKATETVKDLTQVRFRWLTLELAEPATPDGFSTMPGISDVETHNHTITMRVTGEADMDALIKKVAQFTVRDMRFEHPDLEDIFLAYYGEEGES
ncbi:MAG: ATP-binding cassette domain-containing protein [Anaerolineales bacterium]